MLGEHYIESYISLLSVGYRRRRNTIYSYCYYYYHSGFCCCGDGGDFPALLDEGELF